VLRFVVSNKELLSKLAPSFFEMTVAMAFDYFAREQVEVAVVETGLGGRLDSTNIVHPVLSVITNIGLDHTALLGDTLEQIAQEKAGIIKLQVPVVVGRKQAATRGVFEQQALSRHAPLIWAEDEVLALSLEQHLRWQKVQVTCKSQAGEFTCRLPLPGDYQLENVQTVAAALDELQRLGFALNEQVVREGLEEVAALTGLMGRWQVLSEQPLVICDTGHNEDGVKWVVRQLLKSSCEKLHIVWGMVGDKDVRGILKLLPPHAVYYFTQAALPRSLDARELQHLALLHGLQGQFYPTVAEAAAAAKKNAGDNDLIFIGGSTFVVAEAL
jgi:dihydrofolate synthase/folylpolyglutamate synthase